MLAACRWPLQTAGWMLDTGIRQKTMWQKGSTNPAPASLQPFLFWWVATLVVSTEIRQEGLTNEAPAPGLLSFVWRMAPELAERWTQKVET